MPVTVDLSEFGLVVLNGSGAGTAKVGPLTERETWSPSSVSVQVSTNTNEAVCNIYCGYNTTQPYFIDASYAGSSGDSTGRISGKTVRSGQYVYAVWTGGDPGATASLTVNGTKDV